MPSVCLLLALLTATPNPHLATAEEQLAQVRYPDAEKSLALARAQPGNSRQALLRILELQGIVAATLGQGAKARVFFHALVALDPERKLPEGLPPRVRTPFYEAKGLVSDSPPMIFSAAARPGEAGPILEATLSSNPLGLGRTARFHLRKEGGSWRIQDEPITAEGATASPGSGRVEWWAELLGEHEASLFSAGSSAEPFTEGPASAVALEPRAEVPELAERGSTGSKLSPAVWIAFGGAGATAVGAIVAGVLSRGSHGQVDNALKDANGVVTGMTQREAAGLREQARTQAIAANVLFGAAAALAATGAAILILSDTTRVAFVPGPGGVVAVGQLP